MNVTHRHRVLFKIQHFAIKNGSLVSSLKEHHICQIVTSHAHCQNTLSEEKHTLILGVELFIKNKIIRQLDMFDSHLKSCALY